MYKKYLGWFCLVGLLLFAGCPGPNLQENVGKVVHVSDGDTFILQPEQGEKLKVRVAYIDCPELNQAYGLEAKAFVLDWAKGKTVAVEILDTDRYGRAIGWVTSGEERLIICWYKKDLPGILPAILVTLNWHVWKGKQEKHN